MYQGLQNQNGINTGYIKAKWEKELNIEISENDWHSMWCAFIYKFKEVENIWLENFDSFYYTPYKKQILSITRTVLEAVRKHERRPLPYILVMPKNSTFFPNDVMVLYFCVLNCENVIIKKDWYLCKILLMACKKSYNRMRV